MIEVLKINDMKAVQLRDGKTGGFLAFDLKELLLLAAKEGPALHWAMVAMGEQTWIMGNDDKSEQELRELATRVEETESGVALTWDGLTAIANNTQQTIWGTYLGVTQADTLEQVPAFFLDSWRYLDRASPRFYKEVDIAIQAVDSSFWLVYARDEAVRERFRSAFKSVESVPLKELP